MPSVVNIASTQTIKTTTNPFKNFQFPPGSPFEEMIKEAEVLKKVADNVTIKVPLTWDGLKACKTLRDKNIMVNVTLCFSSSQALLAAKSGANFISPFVGRLDDIATDGMNLISEIKKYTQIIIT